MSQNAVAVRQNKDLSPTRASASKKVILSQGVSLTTDFAAWERLFLDEESLADAPPLSLESMRRESLYGDPS